MNRLIRSTVLFAIGLLILAIPFIFLFDLQGWIVKWLETRAEMDSATIGGIIFSALAADILLPIPSTGVITIAGDSLGLAAGILICWLGMTTAVVIGYWLSRWCGTRFTNRFVQSSDFESVQSWQARYGASALMLLRPIPVLAEASVLVAGLYRMSFWRFFIATGFANLVMVAVFCCLGKWAGESGWLLLAIVLSLLAPLVGLFYLRRVIRNTEDRGTD